MADKFGMMSQAYFKGKRELLEWASDFLQMDIPKVETLATGAHYCQLLDALHPGSIKMNKVNFGAHLEENFVQNWKLVQIAFEKKGIQKLIPVLRLVKSRFQDNLEFLQWFHHYFQSTYHPGEEGYDALARRKKCKGGNSVKTRAVRKRKMQSSNNPAPTRRRENSGPSKPSRTTSGGDKMHKQENARLIQENEDYAQENTKLQAEVGALNKELTRLTTTAQAIEKERDWYFSVLLKVETICSESPNADQPELKKIAQILYESNESPKDSPRAQAKKEGAQARPEAGVPMDSDPASQTHIPTPDAGPLMEASPDASIDLGQGEPLVDMED